MKKIAATCGILAATLAAGCSTTTKAPAPRIASPTAAPKPVSPYRWTNGFTDKAREAMLASLGPVSLKPGEYRWMQAIPKDGDTRIVVDLYTQMAFVYRGDQVVGVSTISSGKKGRETPLGFWSVLQKKRMHRSRKYDNAPMPFMQRIDDHGIAFHAGAIPGYPASHGCIRLPAKFAEKLYGLTAIGTKVVIEG